MSATIEEEEEEELKGGNREERRKEIRTCLHTHLSRADAERIERGIGRGRILGRHAAREVKKVVGGGGGGPLARGQLGSAAGPGETAVGEARLARSILVGPAVAAEYHHVHRVQGAEEGGVGVAQRHLLILEPVVVPEHEPEPPAKVVPVAAVAAATRRAMLRLQLR